MICAACCLMAQVLASYVIMYFDFLIFFHVFSFQSHKDIVLHSCCRDLLLFNVSSVKVIWFVFQKIQTLHAAERLAERLNIKTGDYEPAVVDMEYPFECKLKLTL